MTITRDITIRDHPQKTSIIKGDGTKIDQEQSKMVKFAGGVKKNLPTWGRKISNISKKMPTPVMDGP